MSDYNRNTVIEDLKQVWPEADFKGVTKDELLFLLEVAHTLQPPKDRTMSGTLRRYRERYEDTVSYTNRMSKHNGDKVAKLLQGLTPQQVMEAAERLLGLEEGELVAKYNSLNPGQQRMNAGNRIRASVKKGEHTMEELEKVLH